MNFSMCPPFPSRMSKWQGRRHTVPAPVRREQKKGFQQEQGGQGELPKYHCSQWNRCLPVHLAKSKVLFVTF